MADAPKPRSKPGLEAIVSGLVEMDEAPPAPKVSAPVNAGVIQERPPAPKRSTMPAEAGSEEKGYTGPKVGKGSRIAPKRESVADNIDGRSRRATRRNSRLNIALKASFLDAFKWWADEEDGRDFCVIIEEWIAEKCPKQLNKLLEERGE